MNEKELLELWTNWHPVAGEDQVLLGDREVIERLRDCGKVADRVGSWDAFLKNWSWGFDDKKLHVDLTPIPYLGSLETAAVIVLYQNPGLSASDYFAEHERPEFREQLVQNLKGAGCGTTYPFLFLNPAHSWHSGFDWWQRKFRYVIEAIAEKLEPRSDFKPDSRLHRTRLLEHARQVLAQHVAAVELLPYHSQTGCVPRSRLCDFESVVAAKRFVAQRALNDTPIVVTRHVKPWDLPRNVTKLKHCIVYEADQARSASLRPGRENGGGDFVVERVWAAYEKETVVR